MTAFEKKEHVASLLGYDGNEPPALSASRVQLGIGSFLLAVCHKLVLPKRRAGLALAASLVVGAQQLLEICSGVRYKLSVGVALTSDFRRSVPAYQDGGAEIVGGVHVGSVPVPGCGGSLGQACRDGLVIHTPFYPQAGRCLSLQRCRPLEVQGGSVMAWQWTIHDGGMVGDTTMPRSARVPQEYVSTVL